MTCRHERGIWVGLYNIIFGVNAHADELLGLLGLKRDSFYRFRDCYLEGKKIAVYTRAGGNNSKCSCDDYDEEPGGGPGYVRSVEIGGDKHSPDCVTVYNYRLYKHPCFISRDDDDFDHTYCTYYFRVPKKSDREALGKIEPEITRNELWIRYLGTLKGNTKGGD